MRTPGMGNLKDVIRSVYGAEIAASVIPLDFFEDEVEIKGYVSKPNVLRSSRAWQTFIVNGRVIENRAMARAIDNAYRALNPNRGYPLAVIIVSVIAARIISVTVSLIKRLVRYIYISRTSSLQSSTRL